MNLPPPPQIPGLPPTPPLQLVSTSEKLNAIGEYASVQCFKNCVGYFSEDSLPYHYGERTCVERCADKLYDCFHLSREVRKKLEMKAKARKYSPSWLALYDPKKQ
mmetsp:Transcript_8144/g.10867  ORF Transcript_8144/g.10867 Transcript_8144/m.10867 type:complete len:105 (-) Transcript_8144:77-391(-)